MEFRAERSTNELQTLRSVIKSRDDFHKDLRESQKTNIMRKENLEKEVEYL